MYELDAVDCKIIYLLQKNARMSLKELASEVFLTSPAVSARISKLEQKGIISPVIGVECQYKHPTVFDDRVSIKVGVEEFRGVKLVISYTMTNIATGEPVLTGKTLHCFTNREGRPIILKKQFPDFDRVLKELAEVGKAQ